jgi:hypothetical protein
MTGFMPDSTKAGTVWRRSGLHPDMTGNGRRDSRLRY